MHLQDILESIRHRYDFVDGMTFSDYYLDIKTQAAVERQLQILTEAAIRLGEDGERLCPGLDWKGYRAMGTVLRHEYHRIDDRLVWDTVQFELPAPKGRSAGKHWVRGDAPAMKRFFTLVVGALAMIAVALLSAFVAMRLAIHGREVDVPTLTGLNVTDATRLAAHEGLNLTLENRFYSSEVPAGHILAQSPPAGAHVRREGGVRITESLGAQRVPIPDLTGQSERAASVAIRRVSLEPGVVARLPVPGDPGVVLTQSPPANSGGADSPRVSLLVSDPVPPDSSPDAWVTPYLVGLTYSAAAARASTAGLHLAVVGEAGTDTASPTATQDPNAPAPASAPATPAATPDAGAPPAAPVRPTGLVLAQYPQYGRRILRGEAIHVTLAHPAAATAPGTALPAQ